MNGDAARVPCHKLQHKAIAEAKASAEGQTTPVTFRVRASSGLSGAIKRVDQPRVRKLNTPVGVRPPLAGRRWQRGLRA